MAFNADLEITDQGIAKITLVGELDGSVAGQFKDRVQEATDQNAKRLVLLMKNLDFMSSAGLRVLVFAKQKMGADVDIYMVGVQEDVLEPIKMTGLDRSVILVDEYDPAEIENI
jgi:anti-anti-sigma factor